GCLKPAVLPHLRQGRQQTARLRPGQHRDRRERIHGRFILPTGRGTSHRDYRVNERADIALHDFRVVPRQGTPCPITPPPLPPFSASTPTAADSCSAPPDSVLLASARSPGRASFAGT